MRAATDVKNLYKWWRDAAYRGAFGPISADNPELGRYRIRRGNGEPWTPVSIELESHVDPETGELTEDEKIVAIIGFRGAQRKVDPLAPPGKDPGTSWWLWAAKQPVTDEAYESAFDAGDWPDAAPGTNYGPPPDSYEAIVDQIVSATEIAAELKEVKDKNAADQAANLKDRIMALQNAAEGMRVAEKKPWLEGERAVEAKYKPHLMATKSALEHLRKVLKPWFDGVINEAKAAVVAAGGSPQGVEIKARAGGMGGRRTGIKAIKVCVIEDFAAAFNHVKEDPDIRDYATKVIERRAKAGEPIPGTKIIEETKVL
jgi:hypothetical protein